MPRKFEISITKKNCLAFCFAQTSHRQFVSHRQFILRNFLRTFMTWHAFKRWISQDGMLCAVWRVLFCDLNVHNLVQSSCSGYGKREQCLSFVGGLARMVYFRQMQHSPRLRRVWLRAACSIFCSFRTLYSWNIQPYRCRRTYSKQQRQISMVAITKY